MNEYAVFYERAEDQMSPARRVVAAIQVESKQVALFGEDRFVNLWSPYFRSQSWAEHQETDEQPLATVVMNKMLPVRMVDEATFRAAVAGLPEGTKNA